MRLRTSLLSFRPICNKNITEKSSTHIIELINKQYFKFWLKISCKFAKIYIFKKSKMVANMAAKMAIIGNLAWLVSENGLAVLGLICVISNRFCLHIFCRCFTIKRPSAWWYIFAIRCSLNWFDRKITTLWWIFYFSKCQNQNTVTLIVAHRWLVMSYAAGKYCSCRKRQP